MRTAVVLLTLLPLALLAQDSSPAGFAGLYEPPSVTVTPAVPPYSLPLDPATLSNWTTLKSQTLFDVTRIQGLLAKNGFGVVPAASGEDVVQAYKNLKSRGIPVLVTADSLLHIYHVQFDETLREVEEREFYPSLLELTRTLAGRMSVQSTDTARLAAGYFAVAWKLLDPAADISFAAPEAGAELALIGAHQGFQASPLFVYPEDYSQYVPRGHYTRSETLQRYFRAMMWYGRMAFLLKNSDILPAPNAELQTMAAARVADALARDGYAVWERIYTVTSFYVGTADDLTPREYLEAVQTAPGGLAGLSDPARFNALRAYLANLRSPRIYGGTGNCSIESPYDPAKIDECLDKSKGMRFLGQRFVPDSYIFQNLVAMDYLGKGQPFTLSPSQAGPVRGFPRGLDVMDLLGSARARAILVAEGDTEYKDYEKQRQMLAGEFAAFSTADWNRNLYWGWLYALKPLLAPAPAGYPSFMQTEAWTDRGLHSALSSWAELRHDTILYAKQSYTPVGTSMPVRPPIAGYVEPQPEFYARLAALTRMTRAGLDRLAVLNDPARRRLDYLTAILDHLAGISVKELSNQPLNEEEENFVRDFGAVLDDTVSGIDPVGLKTTLAADVHTDANTLQALEEALGYVDWLVAAAPQADGSLWLVAGPSFSYYEFKQPVSARLTDEAWREMLAKEKPARPGWTASFLGR